MGGGGRGVSDELLTPGEAAGRLGVAVPTLYGWLGLSRRGLFVVRGMPVTVAFFQTGPKGRGRIRIPAAEVARLLELMRAPVVPPRLRRPSATRGGYPGITVPLGRPP